MLRTLEDEKDAVKQYLEDLKRLLSVWVPAEEDAGAPLGTALEPAAQHQAVEAEVLWQREALQ
eukprot:4542044-Amphidinium_carterae.1